LRAAHWHDYFLQKNQFNELRRGLSIAQFSWQQKLLLKRKLNPALLRWQNSLG